VPAAVIRVVTNVLLSIMLMFEVSKNTVFNGGCNL